MRIIVNLLNNNNYFNDYDCECSLCVEHFSIAMRCGYLRYNLQIVVKNKKKLRKYN